MSDKEELEAEKIYLKQDCCPFCNSNDLIKSNISDPHEYNRLETTRIVECSTCKELWIEHWSVHDVSFDRYS